jgi:NDP-sugar pyrophosphorylase family protein
MKIIIPMSGNGQRFTDVGYRDPKPIIKIGGRYMIEYVLDMFDKKEDEFMFICDENHLDTTDMANILKGYVNKCHILSINSPKLGPVPDVLNAESFIRDDEPIIIAYCDNPIVWDYDDFKAYVDINDVDGCIVSHTGFHPHTLSSNMFAYSKTDKHNRVSEIKEKSSYTNDRFKEHASSGVYYFKRGDLVKVYFHQAIKENVSHNGEFYVTLVFNLLIRDGLSVYSYLNDTVLAFGTPAEVENFEAWMTLLKGWQVHSTDDLIDCYAYWKDYVDNQPPRKTR